MRSPMMSVKPIVPSYQAAISASSAQAEITASRSRGGGACPRPARWGGCAHGAAPSVAAAPSGPPGLLNLLEALALGLGYPQIGERDGRDRQRPIEPEDQTLPQRIGQREEG